MIAASVADEIRRLLAEGKLTQREIAEQVGASRGTVNAIAVGRRRAYRRGPSIVPPSGPPVRCPGCGGRVQMPCLRCQLRAIEGQDKSAPANKD